MTENELQQLSKDVAKKYDIPMDYDYGDIYVYLHEDSARCFDLMVEHEVDIEPANNGASSAYVKGKKQRTFRDELHTDHNNDKHLATRVAILKALLAKD